MTTNRVTPHLVTIIATALAVAIAPSYAPAAMSPEITLAIVGGENNQFELSSSLNTLTPLLGTLRDTRNATISGNLNAILDLNFSKGIANPTILGINLASSQLVQSTVSFQFPIELGLVEFTTTELNTLLATNGVFQPVDGGHFAAEAVQLVQNGGEATVHVPQKPPAHQNLSEFPVLGRLADGVVPTSSDPATIDLSLLSLDGRIATYEANLSIPLIGRTVAFDDVGLPVDLSYDHGTLVATGTFEQVIPEPGTLLLAVCLALAMQLRPVRGTND